MNSITPSTRHTPGEWYADLVDLVIYAKTSNEITEIAVVHQQLEPTENSDITSGNALVLAAAPDLLREAKRYASDCDTRIGILKEELAEYPSADTQDQIAHWEATKAGVDKVIARAEGR